MQDVKLNFPHSQLLSKLKINKFSIPYKKNPFLKNNFTNFYQKKLSKTVNPKSLKTHTTKRIKSPRGKEKNLYIVVK